MESERAAIDESDFFANVCEEADSRALRNKVFLARTRKTAYSLQRNSVHEDLSNVSDEVDCEKRPLGDCLDTSASFNLWMDFLLSVVDKEFAWRTSDAGIKNFRRVCAAVSGGSDSMALLILSAGWAKASGNELVCVTVDHKLRPESGEEARFVGKFCESLGINHEILEWIRPSGSDVKIEKLEESARDARYSLIEDFCAKENVGIVLTGHTWNDQLETFEMRKQSGSSDSGLAGMSRIRSLSANTALLRPLLHISRERLRNFLADMNVGWKDDPTNDMSVFKRVVHRKRIASYDSNKLRKCSEEIERFGKTRRETEIEAVAFLKDEKSCLFSDLGYVVLSSEKFEQKSSKVQAEILKRLIWDMGGKKYATNITEDVLKKITSHGINTIGRCLLKVNWQNIMIFRENRNLETAIRVDNRSDSRKNCYRLGNFLITLAIKAHDSWHELLSPVFMCDLTKYIVSCYKDDGVMAALPCVCLDGKIVFIHGLHIDGNTDVDIDCRFIHKTNLFDIFL